MTASRKPPLAGVDVQSQAVVALEVALADRPISLMIVAEYSDGVRVFSVPHSPALQRGLHLMAEGVIWPETIDGEDS
jgi:hypothetical protein